MLGQIRKLSGEGAKHSRLFPAAWRGISAILCAVRKAFWRAIFPIAVTAAAFAAWPAARTPLQETSPQQVPPDQTAPPTEQAPPSQPAYSGPVIVLNPAHGGTDPGARGENGLAEKDIVLEYGQAVRATLEAAGYRVVMTRSDDSNPSYDDRDAMANEHHDAIFISLHVASTGTIGTVRTYYYQFWTPFSAATPTAQTPAPAAAAPPSAGLEEWDEAQRPYTDRSRLLADLMQAQMAQSFSGSPAASTGAEVRELRSVAAPAIAIEISSVAVPDENVLKAFEAPLSTCIARTLEAFRPANTEAK
ncbi:MAG: N-acetylmuramoyl-L-alanine amidase [Candidatus Acidiferrales bacterium]